MNPWTVFLSIAAHHSEPADPDLLEWIKDFIDNLFQLGPWTIVAILALLILLIPVGIVAVYLFQQRRHSGTTSSDTGREESQPTSTSSQK